MKILKTTLKVLLALVTLLLLVVLTIILIDQKRTSYLQLDKYPELQNKSYLIKNVQVIPMTKDTVLTNFDVLVENGTIKEVAQNISDKDIEIIDGNNQFLIPGLIDMHVHIWDKQELGLYLANGVTGVRNLWGLPFHLDLKEQINNQELVAPSFYTSSPKLTGKDDLGDDKVQIRNPKEARALVQSYKNRGYDFIKTYAGMTEAEYIAIVEEAEALQMDVVAHPSFKVEYTEQFHPQIATIEHTEDIYQQALNYQLDSVKAVDIAKIMAERDQIFSPTITGFYKIFEMLENSDVLNSESAAYMNPLLIDIDAKNQVNRWQEALKENSGTKNRILSQHQFHLYLIKLLHDAGVTLVSSSDAGIGITTPGASIKEELAFYAEAGLSNYEVLKTATINPSKTHQIMNDLGTIAVGKKANLLLLDGNPLEDLDALKKINWIMVHGRKVEPEQLNMFTLKAKSRKTKLITALRYLQYLWVER